MKLLYRCALAAFLLEVLTLMGISTYQSGFFSASSKSTLDEDQFIDAQMFEFPTQIPAQLTEVKKVRPVSRTAEPKLSKVPHKGISTPVTLEEENQTQEAPPSSPDHGPVAVYAPSPIIPSYLQHQDLKAHVVIVFYIPATGKIAPRLIRSSGNEELDALALRTVQRWEFQPAVKDNAPVDSKVSLKIVFKVE